MTWLWTYCFETAAQSSDINLIFSVRIGKNPRTFSIENAYLILSNLLLAASGSDASAFMSLLIGMLPLNVWQSKQEPSQQASQISHLDQQFVCSNVLSAETFTG